MDRESVIRYRAFAEAADKEGMPNAAKVFRAVAKAKMVHALSHFRAANATDTTAENLNLASEEETYDYKNAYPPHGSGCRKGRRARGQAQF